MRIFILFFGISLANYLLAQNDDKRIDAIATNSVNVPIIIVNDVKDLTAVIGKFHLLLVACKDYKNSHLESLDNPIKDAKKLRDTLTKNYHFDSVKFLENPVKEDVMKVMDSLSKKLGEKDNLVIFYTGHGEFNTKNNLGYLQLCDAKKDIPKTWLSNDELLDKIWQFKVRKTLLILDCCFSGGILKQKGKAESEEISNFESFMYEQLTTPSSTCFVSTGQDIELDDGVFVNELTKVLSKYKRKLLEFNDVTYWVINRMKFLESSNKPYYGVLPLLGRGKHELGSDFVLVRK